LGSHREESTSYQGERTALVVSVWSGNPESYLASLCASLDRYPAGVPYDAFLTANGPEYRVPRELASRFREVWVRPNEGYNLGAWDHAWRRLPEYERFLFIQDDCRALRAGWLRDFARAFDGVPRCGAVGEHLNRAWDRPWDELEARGRPAEGLQWEGVPVSRATFYRRSLRRWGVAEGPTARHLTTVVQYTSRAVLEEVGGYRHGRTYHEAIAAEIAFSRSVEASGRELVQVGRRRHSRIGHREWASDALLPRLARKARRALGGLGGRAR
jgi:hypothetical protein